MLLEEEEDTVESGERREQAGLLGEARERHTISCAWERFTTAAFGSSVRNACVAPPCSTPLLGQRGTQVLPPMPWKGLGSGLGGGARGAKAAGSPLTHPAPRVPPQLNCGSDPFATPDRSWTSNTLPLTPCRPQLCGWTVGWGGAALQGKWTVS